MGTFLDNEPIDCSPVEQTTIGRPGDWDESIDYKADGKERTSRICE